MIFDGITAAVAAQIALAEVSLKHQREIYDPLVRPQYLRELAILGKLRSAPECDGCGAPRLTSVCEYCRRPA